MSTVTLADSSEIWYIPTIFCGKALRQIYTLSIEVGSTTIAHLNCIILGLGTHFFIVDFLSKKKCVMRCVMRKLRKIKVIHFTVCHIYINDYFVALPGAHSSDKNDKAELNEIFLNSMANILNMQACVQGFDFEYITLKNM